MRQWLEIFLAEKRFEEVLAIEARLLRFGVLDDDTLKYALAYVHYSAQQFDESEAYLKSISDEKVYANSVKLLKAIEVNRKQSAHAEQ